MKKMKLFGLAAITIMLICSLGFIGCSNGSTSSGGPGPGPGPGVTKYAVTIDQNGGTGATGAGEYAAGARVTVVAGTAPTDDEAFSKWETTDVLLENERAATITFTMPAKPVALKTIWGAAYLVTITGGTVDASNAKYAEGATVTITAGAIPDGQVWKEWTTPTTGVTFASKGSLSTTFTMPPRAATVVATYQTLYVNYIASPRGWDGVGVGGGDRLMADGAVLAVGPYNSYSVWGFMTDEDELIYDFEAFHTTRFAIMNMKTGKFINVKGVDSVSPSGFSSASQVKLSDFENTDDFWWRASGRNDFMGTNIYNERGNGELGMLSYAGNDGAKASTGTSGNSAVCLVTIGDAKWNIWAEGGRDLSESGEDGKGLYSGGIGGLKFECPLHEWPFLYTLTVGGGGKIAGGEYDGQDTGSFEAGTSVNIAAPDRTAEKWNFVQWASSDIPISGATNSAYTVVIPEKNITVTATWEYVGTAFDLEIGKDCEITSCTDSAETIAAGDASSWTIPPYKIEAGAEIVVTRRTSNTVGSAGHRMYIVKDDWKGWTATGITIPSADKDEDTLTFTMPNTAVTLTAEFDFLKLYSIRRGQLAAAWDNTTLGFRSDKRLLRINSLGHWAFGDVDSTNSAEVVATAGDEWLLMSENEDDYSGKPIKAQGKRLAIMHWGEKRFVNVKGLTATLATDNISAGNTESLVQVSAVDVFEDIPEFWWYIASEKWDDDHFFNNTNFVSKDADGKIVGVMSARTPSVSTEEVPVDAPYKYDISGGTIVAGNTWWKLYFVKYPDTHNIGYGTTWASWTLANPIGQDEVKGANIQMWFFD